MIQNEAPQITFHDSNGRVLATASLPNNSLVEGEQAVKDIEINAPVTSGGKVDHYIVVTPKGEAIKGAVIERHGHYARAILLDNAELKAGQVIKGRFRIDEVED